VIAFKTAEGWSRDVTEDIANVVLARRSANAAQSQSPRRSS
jgi:hypothetical protein